MDIQVEFNKLIKSALNCADTAAHYAVEPADDPAMQFRHEAGAVDVALRGLTYIQSAKTLYIMADHEDTFFEQIFDKYETFVREITTSFMTNHSYQWTLFEKDQLFNLVQGTELEVPSAYDPE